MRRTRNNPESARKNSSRRKNPEAEFQIALVRDLLRVLPDDCFLTAFPAGANLGPIVGARLKRMGLVPGMPDLILLHHGYCFGLELKAARGTRSTAQKETHKKLGRCGVDVKIARSLDDALDALKEWGIPTRIVGPWKTRRNMCAKAAA